MEMQKKKKNREWKRNEAQGWKVDILFEHVINLIIIMSDER